MRLFQLFLLFLACCTSYSERCDGTCAAMDSMAGSLGASCTKSADCLILNCPTPPKARNIGVVAKPRIQIYPCETPVKLNLQVHGSFLGSTINENRNFTGNTDFSQRLSIFTAQLHVRMQQYQRKISFKFTATFAGKTYTVIPATDIPIDKSGCEGVATTTPNPLCTVVTTTVTTLATTHPTVPAVQNTTMPTVTTAGPNVTTVGPNVTTAMPNMTTAGPNVTTAMPNMTTVGPNVTTVGPNVTTVGPNMTTVGPNMTTSGPNMTTSGPNVTTSGPNMTTSGPNVTTMMPNVTTSGPTVITTGPVINNIPSTNPVSSGTIGGTVAGILIPILLICVAIATAVVLFLVYRHKKVKYSRLKEVSLEM